MPWYPIYTHCHAPRHTHAHTDRHRHLHLHRQGPPSQLTFGAIFALFQWVIRYFVVLRGHSWSARYFYPPYPTLLLHHTPTQHTRLLTSQYKKVTRKNTRKYVRSLIQYYFALGETLAPGETPRDRSGGAGLLVLTHTLCLSLIIFTTPHLYLYPENSIIYFKIVILLIAADWKHQWVSLPIRLCEYVSL